jgi:hypothetical protein
MLSTRQSCPLTHVIFCPKAGPTKISFPKSTRWPSAFAHSCGWDALLVLAFVTIGAPHQHRRYVPPAAVVSNEVAVLPEVVLVRLSLTTVSVMIEPGEKISTGLGIPHVSKIDTHELAGM